MTRKIPIVAAALALAGTTGAAEHFVAADGCDQADGSAARPWRTIQRAADAAKAGAQVPRTRTSARSAARKRPRPQRN